MPTDWVTAGGGVLLYGAGKHLFLAAEETPDVIIASLDFDHDISEALILRKHAILSEDGLGLRILDLEDPSNPIDLGSYDLPGTAFHLASWGSLLFIGGDEGGVRVLEVFSGGHEHTRNTPQLLFEERGFFPIGDAITAMTISVDGRAYIAVGGGIRVYDVSDPAQVVPIGDIPVSVPIKSMVINGNHLFISAGAEGLLVMDVTTPESTSTLARYYVPSGSVYLAGRQGYMGAEDGLHMLQAGPVTEAMFDVQVIDFAFSPATVNIATGDTVRWIWMAGGHSTTSGQNCIANGIWNSGVQAAGFIFTRTFNTQGTFPYFCIPHCTIGMVGTVRVAAPGISMSVTPAPVSFGKAGVGQSSDQVITIKNLSSSIGPLTGNVGVLSSPFSVISGGGAFTLAPGQSTSVILRFLPSAVGISSGTLEITHNATNRSSPTNVRLSGTGVTTPVPRADLVLSSISGPGTGVVGKTIAISSTVTNQGTAAANNVVIRFFISDVPNVTPDAVRLGKRFVLKVAPGASKGPASTNVLIPTGLAPGAYFIGAVVDPASTIKETDKTNNTTFDLTGIVICPSLSRPTALLPPGGATNVSTTPTLDWSDVPGASNYDVQVATNLLFTNIVRSISGLATSQWTVDPALTPNTTYFWRARGTNQCSQGPWSFKRKFKTAP
jgi:plastocyanin